MIEVDEVPAWLEEFAENVSAAYEIMNPSDKALGWRCQRDDAEDDYEVIFYPNLVEIDGHNCLPGNIRVEVAQVLDLFDEVEDISWSYNSPDSDSNYLSIEGIVNGHGVWLRLQDGPPDGDLPTARVHEGGAFEDVTSTEQSS